MNHNSAAQALYTDEQRRTIRLSTRAREAEATPLAPV